MGFRELEEFWKNEDGVNNEEIAEYTDLYRKTIDAHMATIKDEDEREELRAELTKHGQVHSIHNPQADANLNILQAEKRLQDRNTSDPAVQGYIDVIGESRAKKLLKDAKVPMHTVVKGTAGNVHYE